MTSVRHRSPRADATTRRRPGSGTSSYNATAPAPETNEAFAAALGHVLRRPHLLRAPRFALRLALGEMADAALLTGQRVLPARAQSLGFRFQWPALEPTLRNLLGRDVIAASSPW